MGETTMRIVKPGISPLKIAEYIDENNQPHNAWFYPTEHTLEIDIAKVITYLHETREMNRIDAAWAMEGLMEYIDDKIKGYIQ
jgi:hypothetical protein